MHREVAKNVGYTNKNVFIMEIGNVLTLKKNDAKITGSVPAGRVFVDGLGVGDVGNIVLRDRKHLAQDGLIIVVVSIEKAGGAVVSGPDIVSRGFVYVREAENLMEEIRKVARAALEDCEAKSLTDWPTLKTAIKNALNEFLYAKTKRRPMILPIIMEV
jgi:ribonuclease J